MEGLATVAGEGVQQRDGLHHHVRIGVAHAPHHRLEAILGQTRISGHLVAHVQDQRPVIVGVRLAGGLFYGF